MELRLERRVFGTRCVIGDLFIDDARFCYTLEDVERSVKVKHQTAIPRGRYEIVFNWSNRFKRVMPLLLDVPGFSGVRIHAGNTAEDTSGCILVGKSVNKSNTALLRSRDAFNELYAALWGAHLIEKIFITITGVS